MTLVAFEDRASLMSAAAARVADALREGLAERGEACAACSGGGTPEPAYRMLAAQPLDWRLITFALVDERCVPLDHPNSNEGLLRRTLAPALDQGARVAPMFSPDMAPAQAADLANAAYAGLIFDVAVMGMGQDGHTASWFPDSEGLEAALDPSNSRVVVALRAPQAAGSADRLSLTLAAVSRARQVLLLITGTEKRARLEAALSGQAPAPVGALFTNKDAQPEVLWAP